MEKANKTSITIETTVDATVETVWKTWTNPADIIQWNSPSPEWHTPRAENDLRVGGKFLSRMEARDGSMGFDFSGVYSLVTEHEAIDYTMDDGRKAWIRFTSNGDQTKIIEKFEAENENSIEMQRVGWQAILDSFKAHTESIAH